MGAAPHSMNVIATPLAAAQWLREHVTGTLYTDSRKVRPGDGFIAWPGAATDGRKYVGGAIKAGASACLVENTGVEAFGFEDATVAAYPQLKAATGPIAAAYYEAPSRQLEVIAVTGTNGKTSTAWWLAHSLSNMEQSIAIPCGLIGTLGVGFPRTLPGRQGDAGEPMDVIANGLTTPDPVLLQKTFREFVDAGVRACAIEASSIGIEERRLDGTHIHTAVFTNFTQDHLDYHGSMDDYWRAKASLFAWPGLQAAVINIDDATGRELAETLKSGGLTTGVDVWTVSCQGPARLQACDITYAGTGLQCTVSEGEERHVLSTHLIGQYNVANLLGVIAAMRSLDVPLAACVKACQRLQPVPGRMECIGGNAQPLVAVDYAHTPDALSQALLALRPLATQRGGQLLCVFGCGGDRDAVKRPLMGAVSARHADRVIVTSDNPRSETPQAIISQVLLGMAGHQAVEVQADRAAAIAQALAQAGDHDVVLVAGKGHEDYQETAGVRRPFSDRWHVEQALAARALTQSLTGAGA